eukprot:1269599-Rhodomonas_salina.1
MATEDEIMELTPELFFLPEVLLNTRRHDFGVRHDGTRPDDVELPPWARGSAHRFIRMHRQ